MGNPRQSGAMPRIDRKEIDPSPWPRSPIDFSDLGRRLLPHVESIVRSLDPGARLKGDELWFADPRKSRDHHRDSASINIHTGAWNARSSDQGGRDVISLVAYSKSETQTDAARTAAQIAGISVISPGQAQRSDFLVRGAAPSTISRVITAVPWMPGPTARRSST